MRKAFRIFLYVVLGYLLLMVLALPPVLTHQLKKIHLQQTGRELQLGGSWVNPLNLAVGLEEASVKDPDGELFWAFEELSIDFSFWGSLFGSGIRFDSVALEELDFHLRQQASGEYNFADIIAFRESLPVPPAEPQQDSEPLAILLSELRLTARRIQYSDLSRPQPFSNRLLGLQLAVDNLVTVGDRRADYQLSVNNDQTGTVSASGQFSLPQQLSSGELVIDQLSLLPVSQYLSPQLAFKLNSGTLSADLDYRLQWGEQFALEIDNSRIELADEVIVSATEQSGPPNQLGWQQLKIDGVSVDSTARQVDIETVQWRGVNLESGHRSDEDGVEVALVELFAGNGNTPHTDSKPAPAEPAAEPWQLTLAQFDIADSRIAWRVPELDGGRGDKPLELAPFNLSVSDISWPEQSPMTIQLESRMDNAGSVAVSGQLSPQSLQGQLQVTLGTPLALINPLLQQSMTAEIATGELNTELTLLFADQSLSQVTGSAGIDNFALRAASSDDLLNWRQLAIADIDILLSRQQVNIGRVSLLEPFAKVHIDADGVTNLQALAKNGAADNKPQAAEQQQAKSTDSGSSGWQVGITEVALEKGRLDFADQSLTAPFAVRIDAFGGTVTGFDSSGDKPAKVDIKGLVDEYAPISLTGSLGPMSPDMALDLAFNFDGMQLTSLSPYSGTYIGRAIDQGQLNIELSYQLQDKRLKGQNRVQIEQLVLGEQVDSPDAVSLPLGAAIALLKDVNGVIKLNVPISGDLNDPSFTLGSVVWSAFQNLIIKTVASPFKLLGSLVGSNDDLQRVPFAPGAIELNDVAQKKLQALADALVQRPNLKITLQGQYDPERDRQYLQQQQLQERLQQRGVKPQSMSDRDDKWQTAVKRLYRQQFADQPVADRAVSELYGELVAAETVGATALVALASARAESARRHLVEILNTSEQRVAVKDASEKSDKGSQVLLDI